MTTEALGGLIQEQPDGANGRLIPRSVLYSLFMEAPACICILRGPGHVFDLVNPRYQRLFGNRQLLGKPIREALPELDGQGYYEILDTVLATGEPYVGKEARVMLDRKGEGVIEESFFNFVYQVMRDADGMIEGVMVFAFEVTDQVVARRQASQLADDLREANRAKDEFIAVISHELRTPMTSILGWARLLRLGGLDESSYNEALDAIERSTKAQAKLIEDLLDESRIASGKLRLERRPADLAEMLEAALAMLKPAVEAKQVHLIVNIADQHYKVFADPMRLQQVISNVLTNAVKFTDEQGTIAVRLDGSTSEAVLEIRDNGRGITAELLPHIFERFLQGDGGAERRSGLGLGLAIARHLVELHGGTITAASDGEAKGAMFTIRLPLMPASPAVTGFVGRHHQGRAAALPHLEGVRVVIVEDEIDNRRMIAAVMERCGAEVQCASTAAGAFAKIEQWKPHVIVSDIALPDLDGCAFMSRLRAGQRENGADTPALALTVFGRPDEQARILAAGFQVFRQKPIEPADLAHDVARLVGR